MFISANEKRCRRSHCRREGFYRNDMAESPDYKALYFQEQSKREVAERAQRQAEAAHKEEQRRREAAEQAQEHTAEKTRKTTLLEFLDACHNRLHSGLTVQTDATLSTQGSPANANNKLRPEKLVLWDDFPARQATIWNDLMDSDFALERHFTSLHTLEETGEALRRRMMGSELDLTISSETRSRTRYRRSSGACMVTDDCGGSLGSEAW